KLFAHRIDSEIQPLQGVGPEQDHVARLGEYHEVGRVRAAGVDDGEADVAFDRPAVGHNEALLALRGDSERVEDGPRYPRQLAPVSTSVSGSSRATPGCSGFSMTTVVRKTPTSSIVNLPVANAASYRRQSEEMNAFGRQ